MLSRYKIHFLAVSFALGVCVLQASSLADLAARYKSALQQEEQQLFSKLLDVFGLTQAQWQSFKKDYAYYNYPAYEKRELDAAKQRCSSEISPALKQKILNIIAKTPIKHSITIARDHSPQGSDIVAMQNALIVDEERFNRIYTKDEHVQAILWHEMNHILHEDELVVRSLSVLRDLAINRSDYSGWLGKWADKIMPHYSEEKWQSSIYPWYKFRERRADLLSGLADKANACALVEVFERFGRCCAERDDHLHPSMSERLAYMSKLKAEVAQFTR